MSISGFAIRVLLVLALLSGGSLGHAGAADAPFVINAIVSTTGPNSFNGQGSAQALQVFEAYANRTGGINGRPIQFNIMDDQSNPQIAVQLLNQIKAQHAAVVVGSDAVAPCAAMAPLVTDGPVMYCTSPGLDPPRGSYAFASTASLKVTLAAMVSYLRQRGFTKIAMMTASDAMGQMTQRYFDTAFALPENKSITVVSREVVNPTDLSFSAQVERVKNSGAQAVLAFATGPAFGTMLREFYEAGLNIPVATSGGNGNPAQLKQYGTNIPSEVLFASLPEDLSLEQLGTSPIRQRIEAFQQAFETAGLKPSPGASPWVWDPASIVLSAYRKLGTGATATQIHDYIENLKGWVGMNGIYDFSLGDQHGCTGASFVMTRWMPATGTFVAVSGLGGAPLAKR